jgi:anthranilate synthase component 1
VVKKDKTSIHFPDETNKEKSTSSIKIAEELYQFTNAFQSKDLKLGFVTNGLFGYTSYDAIPLFEDIQFKNQSFNLPLIQYHLFRFTIVFNHFNNELFILENLLKDEDSNLQEIKDLLVNRSVTTFHFKKTSDETSNFTDEAFLKKIAIGQAH